MRRTLRTAVAALMAVTALGAAPPAHADPPGGSAPARLPAGKSWTVTLVTGDVVRVRTAAGKVPTVSVTPGEGRKTTFSTSIRPDGTIRVIPADVAGLVGEKLDPALFEVTGLIEQGYDDSGTKDVPLIVQRDPGVRPFAALGGTLKEGRQLPSLGAVAARQPKREAHRLSGALKQRSAGGIRKIWLDRRVRATTATTVQAPALDRNLTQVGAPTAWNAGYTGEGVEVAVLDTGADANHPDLKGRIAESRDFSGSGSTADRNGHGTHVAATIAGTGAGSGGERKGVAPEASLLVGKVLDDEGYGTDSMVIAGMEWAAPRAGVVNMSLGGWEPSDGTDPLSTALDRLTERHGTLFVVASGNDGMIGGLPAPGAAGSALTVGAVDGADRLADFSNRGPRGGRPVAKPEIVAPGVEVVAARAEGTSMGRPIDSRYTAASGTSMAAPHVAGAAALLAQRHPGWRAADLKAALTGAADPAQGGDVFERGAGRLDAGAAVTAPVTAGQGIVDLGASPFGGTEPLTGEVTWKGRAGTTLSLSVKATDREGRDASSAVRLSASSVQVPANGTAKVGLRVDPAGLPGRGLHGVEVVAQSGGTVVRTPLTFHAEPRMHTLTLKATPLPGVETFDAYAEVINVGDVAELMEYVELDDGTATLRVPEGRYNVMGKVYGGSSFAIVGDPDVVVDRDVTVTLDAARAEQVAARVTDRTTQTEMVGAGYLHKVRQGYIAGATYALDPGEKIYVQPTEEVTTGTFEAFAGFRLTAPGEVYDLVRAFGDRFPEDPAYTVTPAERGRLARVDQRFAAFDGDATRQMGHKRYGHHEAGIFLVEASSEVRPGTTRTDYLSPGALWTEVGSPGMVEDMVDQLPFREVSPGGRESFTWGRQPVRPGPYSRLFGSLSECERWQSTRTRGVLRVALVPLQTRVDGFDCGFFEEDPLTHRLALYANGEKIAEHTAPAGEFSVPEKKARYRLEYDVDASKILPVSVRTSTAWSFTSKAPSDHSSVLLPLLLVDYDLALDLHNRPVPGKESVFTVAPYGGGSSRVTSFKLWTSTDDGATWTKVTARALGDGRYAAALPATGNVSLRVLASDDRGSVIDQRIIRAYRTG
ncbi:S8 family peptidase [Thermomonospora cellulosilytica]|uniref:Subtilisin family serine protease n=1 Tax=Thermomonospora cellulosilytica TaxID=1411118 RepID=A0A7W3R7A9_9ACTN|nr:S8 family serine peptidase [Thermomonospora cellulosilytica]MBA9002446.1 subtilisin family serine protease [Thermomonospora cellulosilytica]